MHTSQLLFLSLNLVWGGYEVLVSHRRRAADGGALDQGTLKLLWRVLYAAIALAVLATWLGIGSLPVAMLAPLRWSGCALIAAGLALRWWAIHVLGRWFTVDVTVQADQPLVDRGPYRWLCHPSYTGALLAFAGLAVGLGNAVALVVVLPAVGWAFVRRIRVEEATLQGAFGARYAAYVAQRWRLLPGLW